MLHVREKRSLTHLQEKGRAEVTTAPDKPVARVDPCRPILQEHPVELHGFPLVLSGALPRFFYLTAQKTSPFSARMDSADTIVS